MRIRRCLAFCTKMQAKVTRRHTTGPRLRCCKAPSSTPVAGGSRRQPRQSGKAHLRRARLPPAAARLPGIALLSSCGEAVLRPPARKNWVQHTQCFWPSWQRWRWAGDEDRCRIQISPINWRWHSGGWRNAGEPPLRLARRSGRMRCRRCFVGTCLPLWGTGGEAPRKLALF